MKVKKLANKDIAHISRQNSLRAVGFYFDNDFNQVYEKPESIEQTLEYIYKNRLRVTIECYPCHHAYFSVRGMLKPVFGQYNGVEFYTLEGSGHAEFYPLDVRHITCYSNTREIVISVKVG